MIILWFYHNRVAEFALAKLNNRLTRHLHLQDICLKEIKRESYSIRKMCSKVFYKADCRKSLDEIKSTCPRVSQCAQNLTYPRLFQLFRGQFVKSPITEKKIQITHTNDDVLLKTVRSHISRVDPLSSRPIFSFWVSFPAISLMNAIVL